MRFRGRKIIWFDRTWFTRSYWRNVHAAFPQALKLMDGNPTFLEVHDAFVQYVATEAAIEKLKRHAVSGCAPCREQLTAIAEDGREDVKRWLIENQLCAEGAFDHEHWLSDNPDVQRRVWLWRV